MELFKYRDLTDKQVEILTENGELNGCGGKAGIINPPDFIFNAKCLQHDFYYWRGGNEIDRYNADLEFYLIMLEDAHNSKHYWIYRFWAYLYFRAVRTFGYKFFHYGEKRTAKDIE